MYHMDTLAKYWNLWDGKQQHEKLIQMVKQSNSTPTWKQKALSVAYRLMQMMEIYSRGKHDGL